jgi:hypothetical protein
VLHAAFELYGHEPHRRVQGLLFDDADFFSALVTRSEKEEQLSYYQTLKQLAHAAPPGVAVRVAYNVGACTAGPALVRGTLRALGPASLPELVRCLEQMQRALAEATEWRTRMFLPLYAGLCADAGAAPEPRFDPLMVGMLQRDPTSKAATKPGDDYYDPAARELLQTLPREHAEAVLIAALGKVDARLRPGMVSKQVLDTIEVLPTAQVADTLLDAIALWDTNEVYEKLDHAIQGFTRWGDGAMEHVRAAVARHPRAAVLQRILRRLEVLWG